MFSLLVLSKYMQYLILLRFFGAMSSNRCKTARYRYTYLYLPLPHNYNTMIRHNPLLRYPTPEDYSLYLMDSFNMMLI